MKFSFDKKSTDKRGMPGLQHVARPLLALMNCVIGRMLAQVTSAPSNSFTLFFCTGTLLFSDGSSCFVPSLLPSSSSFASAHWCTCKKVNLFFAVPQIAVHKGCQSIFTAQSFVFLTKQMQKMNLSRDCFRDYLRPRAASFFRSAQR